MKNLVHKVNQKILDGERHVAIPFAKRWLLYLPILVLIMYIGLGYVSYLICPLEWPLRYDIRTAVYMFLVGGFLIGGYLFATKRRADEVVIVEIEVNKFYNKLLIIGAILYIPSSYYKTGSAFPTIISSLINPGAQYYETLKLIGNRPGYYNLLGMFYIVTFAIIVLTYFYWDELGIKQRILGGGLAFLYILIEMSSGKNIGIVILGISISVCYLSKICRKSAKGKRLSHTLFTILVIGIMVFMFGYNLRSRTGYSSENESVYEQNLAETNVQEEENKTSEKDEIQEVEPSENELIESCIEIERESIEKTYDTYKMYENEYHANLEKSADEYLKDYAHKAYTVSDYYRMPDALTYVHVDNKIYQSIPDSLKFIYTMGTIYLSNGYHGLSLALYLPFESSFGLGHLKAVQYYLDKLFGISGDIPNYENKLIDIGWPVGLRWETAFAQFASDFSFIGSLIVMFGMGWLLARLWMEMVAGGNWITTLLFAFYCVQFFFITSWWYAGLTGGYFITFYVPLFLWIWQRCVIYKNNKK